LTLDAATEPVTEWPGRVFDLRWTGTRPMTVNVVAKIHRQQWAAHTKHTRELWWALTKAAKVPRLLRARIIATPLHSDRRSPQDCGACAPEVKAAVDGIVDAGVLFDDGPQHLLSLMFLPPVVCGDDGLQLRIEEA
jgi:hypothetical protein